MTSFGLLGIFLLKKLQSDTFSQDNIMAYTGPFRLLLTLLSWKALELGQICLIHTGNFIRNLCRKKSKIFVWLFAIFQQHCGHYVLLREVEKSAKHSKLDKYMWSLFPYFILLAEKTI